VLETVDQLVVGHLQLVFDTAWSLRRSDSLSVETLIDLVEDGEVMFADLVLLAQLLQEVCRVVVGVHAVLVSAVVQVLHEEGLVVGQQTGRHARLVQVKVVLERVDWPVVLTVVVRHLVVCWLQDVEACALIVRVDGVSVVSVVGIVPVVGVVAVILVLCFVMGLAR
jgi:hypothetical protein